MIHFRQVDSIQKLDGAVLWYLEYYLDDEPCRWAFPVGTAYVLEIPKANAAQLNFVLVADRWRGQGIAKQLLLAAKERWPNIGSTGAIGPEGAGLLSAVGFVVDEDD